MKLDKTHWIKIWTEPRKTISKIVSKDPNQNLWILAWIYGFLSLLNGSQSLLLGDYVHFALILVLSILIAPFWGMLIFSVWSWVVQGIGKILKGQGNFSSIRAAFAWSCVPLIINIFLWMLLLFIFDSSLFQTPQMGGGMGLLIFILIAKLIVIIWSLVIYINALAEVQQFSIARSIINILISWIVVGAAIALIWIGIGFLVSSPPSHVGGRMWLKNWTVGCTKIAQVDDLETIVNSF
ncbi:MAG TPA: Yip1 family protein [Chlamydiales bacterium]|nr:Yip1 family protein [Chlamydiales bacterium]